MNICQNLIQKLHSFKKHFPKQNFTNFGLILGSPGGLKITKNGKKTSRKNSKKIEGKKTQKNLKKGSGAIGPAECADRWGGLWRGEEAFQESQKQCKKLKKEIEAKS